MRKYDAVYWLLILMFCLVMVGLACNTASPETQTFFRNLYGIH